MRKYLALLLGFVVMSIAIRPSSTYTPAFINQAVSRGSNSKQSIMDDSLVASQPVPNQWTAPSGQSPARGLYHVTVTGFSSAVDETDNTPFITASGDYVYEGVAAANWLPIGTVIRIPSLFGNRVFTIEDRMAPQNQGKVDIWFPAKEQAIQFGVRHVNVEVL